MSLVLLAPAANAQAAVKTAIHFGGGYPATPAVGEVVARGVYVVEPGWVAKSVELIAWPAAGGVQKSVTGKPAGGRWGVLRLKGLVSGKRYTVFAIVTVRKGNEEKTFYSPLATIRVG